MRKGALKTAVLASAAGCLLAVSGAATSVSAAPAGQHRVYPGANDAAREQARAQRNAPNLFCDKHENECE